jgi:8-oxo-dGTP pyrophosphatase MutT (NUDIX family)
MSSIKKTVFCNNCGKIGHLFHQCKIPITSIGIIVIRIINSKIETLMIRRKDSLAFVDFMRGKYSLEDKDYIENLFEKMTINERNFIKNSDFYSLWNYLWGENIANQYKNEEKISKYKFDKIKEGYYIFENNYCKLDKIIDSCKKIYDQPEWGFPKGRRNYQEKDIMCGLREFEEETGYNKSNVLILGNILPYEEIFTGSNYKSYKHKYFIGYIKNNIYPENDFQIQEISKIEWVDIENAPNYIRNYNVEKKNIIIEINKLLNRYKLYM